MAGEELSFDDARAALRRHGGWPLVRGSFTRFRYGDGFSHARGFALQLALATVPLVIALTGLAGALGAERVAEVVARTAVAISPGDSDQLVEQTVERPDGSGDQDDEDDEDDDARGEDLGELALGLGLLTAFAAMTSAFAQLERGANRIYGTERDRPALHKYGRAAALTATAGVALGAGLLLIVAGGPFGQAFRDVYGWGVAAGRLWDAVRWPTGLLLMLLAVTLLFRFAPRRQQPGPSWLAVGAAVTVLVWLGASGLLALYVSGSDAFGDTYGPLTAVMALLLWANVSGMALLGGIALSAQLEAVRAGQDDPLLPDSDDDGVPDGLEEPDPAPVLLAGGHPANG
jgi:YihY family inner membrane protein